MQRGVTWRVALFFGKGVCLLCQVKTENVFFCAERVEMRKCLFFAMQCLEDRAILRGTCTLSAKNKKMLQEYLVLERRQCIILRPS